MMLHTISTTFLPLLCPPCQTTWGRTIRHFSCRPVYELSQSLAPLPGFPRTGRIPSSGEIDQHGRESLSHHGAPRSEAAFCLQAHRAVRRTQIAESPRKLFQMSFSFPLMYHGRRRQPGEECSEKAARVGRRRLKGAGGREGKGIGFRCLLGSGNQFQP